MSGADSHSASFHAHPRVRAIEIAYRMTLRPQAAAVTDTPFQHRSFNTRDINATVSTCPPLLNRFMVKVSTQFVVNLVGILVAYLGRSPIKLLSPVPLISAVRFVGNCHFDNSLC